MLPIQSIWLKVKKKSYFVKRWRGIYYIAGILPRGQLFKAGLGNIEGGENVLKWPVDINLIKELHLV